MHEILITRNNAQARYDELGAKLNKDSYKHDAEIVRERNKLLKEIIEMNTQLVNYYSARHKGVIKDASCNPPIKYQPGFINRAIRNKKW